MSTEIGARYPTVLVTGAIGPDEADLTDLARSRGADIRIIPALGREIHPWRDIAVAWSLYRLLRELRPSIVHTHTAKAGAVGRLVAILARVPIRVHTFHGHVLHGYFGPLKSWVFLQIERVLARFSTVILAVSASQADELVDTFRVCGRGKIRVVPLGLELDRFSAPGAVQRRAAFRAEISAGDAAVISCVSRLVPIKNHAVLLRAFAALRARSVNAVLAVVGGGSEESGLRRLADGLGIAASVRFLGWRSDLDVIYAGSDIAVLSSDNEGTPVSLIEALAAGCAVVSTDVGGVRDVLEGGRLGVLVPPGDPGALATALDQLLSDGARRRTLAAAGLATIPERYGKQRLLDDMTRLYDELVEHRRSNSAGY